MADHPAPRRGDQPALPRTVPPARNGTDRARNHGPATRRGPEPLTISHGSTFLVSGADGTIGTQGGRQQGLYADDTRFLRHHSLRMNDGPLDLLGASTASFRHARWIYNVPDLVTTDGHVGGDTRVTVALERLVGTRRLHEDITVRAYGGGPGSLLLSLRLETDFADLFEVRSGRWQRRNHLATTWEAGRLETAYRRKDFVRRCLVRVATPGVTVTFANGALHFPVDLEAGGEWSVCLQYDLITSRRSRPPLVTCPTREALTDRAALLHRRWHRIAATVDTSDPRLAASFDQAIEDFAALRLYDLDFSQDVWLPAAGIPWFVAVFGRDSIIASLQALPVHPLFAVGTLQKLAAWQSTVDDPVRDAEPGKICHEMRVGEWAQFHTIPHSPYYGTADATPLYLLLLAESYRWFGDAERLERFRSTAQRGLEWIDRFGDRDGDGFQEYAPRAPTGYRNQCWRDAEDGVLDEQGSFPPHPIGTCEMQAYVVAAKRELAPLFAAWGDQSTAARLTREAEDLRRRLIDAFWMEDEGTLALALDGNKRQVPTATSNPGHCLWLGVLDNARAQRVADRLMRGDLFAGWGLRTLSTEHPAYDAHSYQRGSVWPHDTMIAAAGLRRYGRDDDAWRLVDGLLAAASSLGRFQMPELFAGLERVRDAAAVPYEQANVPQAWSAGAVFQAIRLLLGLEPDVPNGRLYVDPALPAWCPELVLENMRVGDERLTIRAHRRPDGGADIDVEGARPGGLVVIRGPRSQLPGPS
ncbi:MAG: glycogen debranching N-terminal domain-containing protein [Candidatus Dormibacteria bacterium]